MLIQQNTIARLYDDLKIETRYDPARQPPNVLKRIYYDLMGPYPTAQDDSGYVQFFVS